MKANGFYAVFAALVCSFYTQRAERLLGRGDIEGAHHATRRAREWQP